MTIKDLIKGMAALDEAGPGYREAIEYARGRIPERFASDAIRRLLESSESGYKFRFAAIPIEVMSDRVQVSSIVSDRGDSITNQIEEIRSANHMQIIEPYMIRELFTLGDAYVLVWPVEQDDDSKRPDLRTAGVEINYMSPIGTRAMYDPGDPLTPLYVLRRWQTETPEGKRWHAEVWYPATPDTPAYVEAWITDPGANGRDEQAWSPYAESDDGEPEPAIPGQNWPVYHDYEQIPIKHARTGLPYGRPEHIDAYGPQDAITKAIMTQTSVIEEYGWPERIRLMDDAQVLETARDAVAWDDPANAPDAADDDLQRVEVTGLKRGAGTETKYYGTKSVEVIEPPDVRSLIDPIEAWIRHMATVTKTPLYEFDQRTGQQLSGVAYERADRPLKAKEKDRKRYLAGFFHEVWSFALDVLGMEPGVISVNWSLPEVVTDPEFWATAQIRESLGVPLATILAEANYDPETVAEWLDAQAEGTTLDRRIARLQALGDALQSMGTATSLGAVDEATSHRLITRIMAEATTPEIGS